MQRSSTWWGIAGFMAVSLLGTLLHFLYDWTDSTVAALFSAVNESTWEHMKLLFFPMFLFSLVQSLSMGKDYEDFWCVKLRGTLIGLAVIPTSFYTLRGVFGTTPDVVNIAIFLIAAAVTYLYETRQFKQGSELCKASAWALATLDLIAVAFWVFIFIPPHIPLFQDPVSGGYGI